MGSCSSDVERPQNLLLIVIDTLRADNLGCYGYPRDTSPAIDTLATRGVLFERAYSTASYTRAAIASLLTGHHPAVHKAVTHHDSMSPEVPTLPEILGEEGYSRVGFYLNENAGTWLGFDRGFERYDNPERHFRTTVNGEERDFFEPTGDRTVTDQAVPFLEEIGVSRPFFLYLHFIGPHDPYNPPMDSRSFLESPLVPELEEFYAQPTVLRPGELTVVNVGREVKHV